MWRWIDYDFLDDSNWFPTIEKARERVDVYSVDHVKDEVVE